MIEPCPTASRTRIDDDIRSRSDPVPVQTEGFPQESFNAIASNRRSDLAAHRNRQSRPRAFRGEDPADEVGSNRFAALGKNALHRARGEARLASKTPRTTNRQSSVRENRPTYAVVSLARPLERRRLKVRRPPGVLIRARKPIFLARLRRLGLNVGCIANDYILMNA